MKQLTLTILLLFSVLTITATTALTIASISQLSWLSIFFAPLLILCILGFVNMIKEGAFDAKHPDNLINLFNIFKSRPLSNVNPAKPFIQTMIRLSSSALFADALNGIQSHRNCLFENNLTIQTKSIIFDEISLKYGF